MRRQCIRRLLASLSRREALVRHSILAAVGLTPKQHDILALLADQDGLSLSELAAGLPGDLPGISRTIFAMEKAGLVTRERSRTDKRVHRFHLTHRGAQLRSKAEPLVRSHDEALTVGLSAAEKRTVSRALRAMLERLEHEQDR